MIIYYTLRMHSKKRDPLFTCDYYVVTKFQKYETNIQEPLRIIETFGTNVEILAINDLLTKSNKTIEDYVKIECEDGGYIIRPLFIDILKGRE